VTGSELAPDLVWPDFYTRPVYSETIGPEVVDLASMAGLVPYPEQALLLDDLFAVDPVDSNRSAVFGAGVVAARQQLKTGLLKQAALGWLFLERVPLVIWSAHEFSTTLEAQQDLIALIDGCSDLSREVAKVTVAAGENAIIMRSGSRIRFKARTSGGGRGLTGDKIILDEAFALRPMHMGALLPTLIQVPDPQVVYASSAGLLKSDVLRGVRDRGRANPDGDDLERTDRTMYAEWGSEKRACESESCSHRPGVEGCALDDRELLEKACFVSARNGRMGVIDSLRLELPPEEFAREVLVWWDDPIGDGAFDLNVWADLKVDPTPASGPLWFAVDVSPGQEWASIVVASEVDGRVRVEVTGRDGVIDHRPGVGWLRERINQLRADVADVPFRFQAGGGFESLVPDLEEDGAQLVRVPRFEIAAACGHFFELFTSKRLAHLGQDDLFDAVRVARQKQIGDSAFVWVRDGLADLAPLYAASLAVWGLSVGKDPAANVW